MCGDLWAWVAEACAELRHLICLHACIRSKESYLFVGLERRLTLNLYLTPTSTSSSI